MAEANKRLKTAERKLFGLPSIKFNLAAFDCFRKSQNESLNIGVNTAMVTARFIIRLNTEEVKDNPVSSQISSQISILQTLSKGSIMI